MTRKLKTASGGTDACKYKRACFLCLKNNYSGRRRRRTHSLLTLRALCRYLSVNLDKERISERIFLCGECSDEHNRFSQLYRELEVTKMKIHSSLRKLHSAMMVNNVKVKEEETEELDQKQGPGPESEAEIMRLEENTGDVQVLEDVRDEIITKCNSKLMMVMPRVVVREVFTVSKKEKPEQDEGEGNGVDNREASLVTVNAQDLVGRSDELEIESLGNGTTCVDLEAVHAKVRDAEQSDEISDAGKSQGKQCQASAGPPRRSRSGSVSSVIELELDSIPGSAEIEVVDLEAEDDDMEVIILEHEDVHASGSQFFFEEDLELMENTDGSYMYQLMGLPVSPGSSPNRPDTISPIKSENPTPVKEEITFSSYAKALKSFLGEDDSDSDSSSDEDYMTENDQLEKPGTGTSQDIEKDTMETHPVSISSQSSMEAMEGESCQTLTETDRLPLSPSSDSVPVVADKDNLEKETETSSVTPIPIQEGDDTSCPVNPKRNGGKSEREEIQAPCTPTSEEEMETDIGTPTPWMKASAKETSSKSEKEQGQSRAVSATLSSILQKVEDQEKEESSRLEKIEKEDDGRISMNPEMNDSEEKNKSEQLSSVTFPPDTKSLELKESKSKEESTCIDGEPEGEASPSSDMPVLCPESNTEDLQNQKSDTVAIEDNKEQEEEPPILEKVVEDTLKSNPPNSPEKPLVSPLEAPVKELVEEVETDIIDCTNATSNEMGPEIENTNLVDVKPLISVVDMMAEAIDTKNSTPEEIQDMLSKSKKNKPNDAKQTETVPTSAPATVEESKKNQATATAVDSSSSDYPKIQTKAEPVPAPPVSVLITKAATKIASDVNSSSCPKTQPVPAPAPVLITKAAIKMFETDDTPGSSQNEETESNKDDIISCQTKEVSSSTSASTPEPEETYTLSIPGSPVISKVTSLSLSHPGNFLSSSSASTPPPQQNGDQPTPTRITNSNCPRCRKGYTDEAQMDDHIIACHTDQIFEDSRHPSLSHIQFKLALERFFDHYVENGSCEPCQIHVPKTEKYLLRKHLIKDHYNEVRDNLITYQQDWLPHLQVDEDPEEYVERSFEVITEGQLQAFVCNVCGKNIRRNSRLDHLRTHGYDMLKCTFCDDVFGRASAKTRHELREHNHLLFKEQNIRNLSKQEFTGVVYQVLDDILDLHSEKKDRCPLCPKFKLSEKQQKVLKWREHMIFRHFDYVADRILAWQLNPDKSSEQVVSVVRQSRTHSLDSLSYFTDDTNNSSWSTMSSEPESLPTSSRATSFTSDELDVALALASGFGNKAEGRPRSCPSATATSSVPERVELGSRADASFSGRLNYPTATATASSGSTSSTREAVSMATGSRLANACPLCTRVFPNRETLDDHSIGSHLDSLFSKSKSPSLSPFQFQLALERFFSQYMSLHKTSCHFCNFKPPKTERFMLRKHLVKEHFEELKLELVKFQRRSCHQLQTIENQEDCLKQSFTADLKDPTLCICVICRKQIVNKYNCRVNHLRAMHGHDMLKCNFCEETFGLSDSRKRHELRVHSHLLFHHQNTENLPKEEFTKIIYETIDHLLSFDSEAYQKHRCPLCPDYAVHERDESARTKWRMHMVATHFEYVCESIAAFQNQKMDNRKQNKDNEEPSAVIFNIDEEKMAGRMRNFMKVKCPDCGNKFTYSELAEHQNQGCCSCGSSTSTGSMAMASGQNVWQTSGSYGDMHQRQHPQPFPLNVPFAPASSYKPKRKFYILDTSLSPEAPQEKRMKVGVAVTPTPNNNFFGGTVTMDMDTNTRAQQSGSGVLIAHSNSNTLQASFGGTSRGEILSHRLQRLDESTANSTQSRTRRESSLEETGPRILSSYSISRLLK